MLSKSLIGGLTIALVCNLAVPVNLRAGGASSTIIPVHWTLTPGSEPNCPNLNPGVTSVVGDGQEQFVVKVTTKSNGTRTMEVNANAYGTAVDNNGNKYSWAYVNHLTFDINSNVGHFTDRFDLVSHGKAPNMTVYLNWDVS